MYKILFLTLLIFCSTVVYSDTDPIVINGGTLPSTIVNSIVDYEFSTDSNGKIFAFKEGGGQSYRLYSHWPELWTPPIQNVSLLDLLIGQYLAGLHEIHAQKCETLSASEKPSSGCTSRPDISPNGCSNPLSFAYPVNAFFAPSCNAHDYCYVDLTQNKANCDSSFYTSMLYQCDTANPGVINITTCKNFALDYYDGVRFFAGSRYNNAQADAQCNKWFNIKNEEGCYGY